MNLHSLFPTKYLHLGLNLPKFLSEDGILQYFSTTSYSSEFGSREIHCLHFEDAKGLYSYGLLWSKEDFDGRYVSKSVVGSRRHFLKMSAGFCIGYEEHLKGLLPFGGMFDDSFEEGFEYFFNSYIGSQEQRLKAFQRDTKTYITKSSQKAFKEAVKASSEIESEGGSSNHFDCQKYYKYTFFCPQELAAQGGYKLDFK